MLLAAVCEVVGNEWGCPVLKPELLTSEGGEWQKLAGKQSVARGQSRSNATFLQVWGGMAKHTKSEATGGDERGNMMGVWVRDPLAHFYKPADVARLLCS